MALKSLIRTAQPIAALLLLMGLAGCHEYLPFLPKDSHEEAHATIAVHDAYATSKPDYNMISAFAIIENKGEEDSLIGAQILDYPQARVELHDVKEGKMVKVESIPIPARSTVELKPGSYHVMGFEIQNPKTSGEITLALKFKLGGEVKVAAPIKAKNMTMENHKMH